ncbi:MAG: chain-length determining protein [Bacteroidaceae bacterium]|nr:chain-length determining protein [Bacteroidaceae bacterium]
MEEQKKVEFVIDLREIVRTLWTKRNVFFKVIPVIFLLSCIWIFPKPRYYRSVVSLAPEMSNGASIGSLGSIASSLGFDLGEMGSDDAIYPLLYPDLFASSNFMVGLFDIHVVSSDKEVDTDYYTYMSKMQKICIWDYPKRWLRKLKRSIFPKKKAFSLSEGNGLNAFSLTEEQYGIVEKVKKKILCNVDKKTMVITINVTDQDPLIAATMADSVRVRLQNYITDYRTNKARVDEIHYQEMADKSLAMYQNSCAKYARYADSHKNSLLQSVNTEIGALENEMQQNYTIYSAYMTQLQAARARVQERTPAFTIIQAACVPVKPAGPKRLIFVVGMCFLACVVTSLYIVKDQLLPQW